MSAGRLNSGSGELEDEEGDRAARGQGDIVSGWGSEWGEEGLVLSG